MQNCYLWTSTVGLLMATEHMVQLPHIELGDKWGTSSMKMQTGSSMCSGPAGLGETAVFLFISLSRERFNCHMAELAGPHQDFCWHHGLCGICAGGGLTSQGSWARGGVYMCPAHVIPALAVVWLCSSPCWLQSSWGAMSWQDCDRGGARSDMRNSGVGAW